MAPQLAFLGLGKMGQAMSENLVAKGNLEKPLLLWNRTAARADELSQKIGHSKAIHSLEDVVSQSDIIWTCLRDQEAVIETFEKILRGSVRGKLFLESSTITQAGTNRLANDLIEAGAEFVAMPVFGEPSVAHAGQLVCIPAGLSTSVSRILPYTTGVVGRAVVDFSGEEPGSASLLKLVGNTFLLNAIEAVAESHVFAEKTGLGVANLQKLITTLFPIGPYMNYSTRMSSGDYYQKEAVVPLKNARVLTSRVRDHAENSGTDLKAYKVACEHLDVAEKHAGGEGDFTGIYGAVRVESGLDFKNSST